MCLVICTSTFYVESFLEIGMKNWRINIEKVRKKFSDVSHHLNHFSAISSDQQ